PRETRRPRDRERRRGRRGGVPVHVGRGTVSRPARGPRPEGAGVGRMRVRGLPRVSGAAQGEGGAPASVRSAPDAETTPAALRGDLSSHRVFGTRMATRRRGRGRSPPTRVLRGGPGTAGGMLPSP